MIEKETSIFYWYCKVAYSLGQFILTKWLIKLWCWTRTL